MCVTNSILKILIYSVLLSVDDDDDDNNDDRIRRRQNYNYMHMQR